MSTRKGIWALLIVLNENKRRVTLLQLFWGKFQIITSNEVSTHNTEHTTNLLKGQFLTKKHNEILHLIWSHLYVILLLIHKWESRYIIKNNFHTSTYFLLFFLAPFIGGAPQMLYQNDKIWIQFGLLNVKISSSTSSLSIWTKMYSRTSSVKNWLLHGVFYPTSEHTDRKCFLLQSWNLYPFSLGGLIFLAWIQYWQQSLSVTKI